VPDRLLLDRSEMADLFIVALQEAFRSGTGGAEQDAALYARPWGLELQDIAAPVHLWHGGQDANVPVSVARYMAEAIPNCDSRFFDEEAHLTLPRNRMWEILRTLFS
jgi:pimeloyl-ACP methyl ester carboxylesterase